LAGALAATAADAGRPAETEVWQLLDRYYRAQREGRAQEARRALEQVLRVDPQNATAWRALGYSLSKSGEHARAAEAYVEALEHGGPDPRLELSAGYAYDQAGAKAEAEARFLNAQDTDDPDIYEQACNAAIVVAPLRRRRLPDPWYLSFYAAPTYDQRIRDGILPLWLHAGRYLDPGRRLSVYGYLKLNADSRSEGGNLPQIYNDNYAGLGIGLDWKATRAMRLYLQAGPDYDLLDRNRARWRTDLVAGWTGYWSWGAGGGCSLEPRWPLASFGDLYANLAHYSRYSNAIGQISLRTGLRLFEQKGTRVSGYLRLDLFGDDEGLYYNNTLEWGPGLSWEPSRRWPLELRLEYRLGRYLRNASDSPDGGDYQRLLFQAIVYFEQ
jgi:hypothetical protein